MMLPVERVWEKNRQPQVVEARSLLCFWPNKELEISMTDLAKRLSITQPAVSITVRRGERISKAKGCQLLGR
jgi:DNA-binding MarR family transcriptional regulator